MTALWLLVRGNPRLLRPDGGALGVAGLDLVEPLRAIILGSRSADAVCTTILVISAVLTHDSAGMAVLHRCMQHHRGNPTSSLDLKPNSHLIPNIQIKILILT